MPARRHPRLLSAAAGAAAALCGLALAAPPASADVVVGRARQPATLLAEPLCTSAGDTLRITVPGHHEITRYTTSSGRSFDVPTDQWQLPARFRWQGDVDLAEPPGPVTVTALAADGSVVARRTVVATACGGWTGRADYLAGGADELGRPLALGTLSEVAETWPGGVRSYRGTTGDLWVLPTGTAYALTDDVARVYRSLGGPSGPLGTPTGNPTTDPRTWDARRLRTDTRFTGGFVRSTPGTGAHAVVAPFTDVNCTQWDQGPEDGYYVGESTEFPTSEATGPLRGGWYAQQYEGGTLVEGPGVGCLPVWNGPIRDYWATTGWEQGPLGYPRELTMSRTAVAFEGGTAFATHPSAAAPRGVVVLDGEMLAVYRRAADRPLERGSGTPMTFSTPTPDGVGRFVRLSGAAGIYASPAGGTHVVPGTGVGDYDYWASHGFERGPLGYPTGDAFETPGRNSFGTPGWGQAFQGGLVYGFGNTANIHAVRGALLDRWAALGYEQSALGFPVADEVAVPGGVRQEFQGGALTWSAATGQVS